MKKDMEMQPAATRVKNTSFLNQINDLRLGSYKVVDGKIEPN
jgi:hypothetical protein